MENLVDKIIEIDKDAENRIKKAEAAKAAVVKEIEVKKQKLIKEIEDKSETKLLDFEKSQKEEINSQIEQITKSSKEVEANIQKFYDLHHDKWLNDIVKNTISG